MRRALIVILMLSGLMTSAMAQVSVGIGFPGVRIGIELPLYPNLVRVPNYPVYYAPDLDSNYFFYDGMYWVLQDDNWYASSWYNGPWQSVDPEWVPLFILRIPVNYYRSPPRYFSGWRDDAPPHWGEHWGNDWQRQHGDWDRWDRASAPAPAPLPTYQRSYPQDRYPRVEQQAQLHNQNYRYQPRDPVVREHFQTPAAQRAAAPSPSARRTVAPVQQSNPSRTRGQADREPAPTQAPAQRAAPPAPVRPEQRAPAPRQEVTPKDNGEPEAQRRSEPPAAARPEQQAPASRQEANPKDERKPEAQQRRPAPKKDRGNNDPEDQDNRNQDNKNKDNKN